MRSNWKRLSVILLFLAVFAFALSGCSGSDGAPGAPGASGASAVVDSAVMTTEEKAALDPVIAVNSVTIASAPVVKFTIKDAKGNGIKGIGAPQKSATATVATRMNLSFKLAKLVPATVNSPSKWVSYIVTSVPTTTVATVLPIQPTTDATGTLVDNGDGSYTYTFYRDIAKSKDVVAVAPTATASNVLADLGDLTYDATKTHRLIIMFSGNVPGTGTMTADATASGVTAVAFANPKIINYDFIPSTGKQVTATDAQREITSNQVCGSCHYATPGHRGADTRNCVLCHNDQLKYGRFGVASVGGVVTAFGKSSTTRNYIIDGYTLADFPIMIHKIHMGSSLSLTEATAGTFYDLIGLKLKTLAYPQDRMNCRKCHNDDVAYPATATAAAHTGTGLQGANWKNNPSRIACGSCHDGIKWADGTGKTLAGATTGHIGGAASNDAQCAICHSAVKVELYHTNIDATTNNPNVPAGATNFTYEISSVTVGTGADLGKPIVKFRIMAVTPPATTATPVTFVLSTGTGGVNPLTGFTGAPSFLVAFADGTNSTVDFNNTGSTLAGAQPTSVSIAKLCNTSVTATATVGTSGTMTGPDASGYYTATLNQAATATLGASVFPTGAKLRTVAINGYFTQVSPAAARHGVMVTKAVGETATAVGESRRHIVDSAKCAQCHEYFQGHGGNRNYNMDGCVVCHNPNLSSSGRTIALTAEEATQNQKDMIHGIHAAGMRTNDYKHNRAKSGANTLYDWSFVVYPGELGKCDSCHLPGTYASVPSGALATTNVTTSNTGASISAVTSVVTNALDTLVNYLAARLTVNATDLVITPYTAACVSCHDSDASKAHMTVNGGKINKERSTVTVADEQCVICHGAGRSADAAALHDAL